MTKKQFIIAIISTLSVIFAAAAPGFWTYITDRSKETHQVAVKSHDMATRSGVKTQVAYELTRQELGHLTELFRDLKGEVRELRMWIMTQHQNIPMPRHRFEKPVPKHDAPKDVPKTKAVDMVKQQAQMPSSALLDVLVDKRIGRKGK